MWVYNSVMVLARLGIINNKMDSNNIDNFKYSLKTHQFNKKRQQIFTKQSQKQSISLQVHDPKHSVSHLLDQNKSQDNYGLAQINRNIEQSKQATFIEEQSKTVKFTKVSGRKTCYNSQTAKPKNINHSISTTAKVKVPQLVGQYSAVKNPENQVSTQQLQQLKIVLYSNEERLKNLFDSINSLYRNTIQLYGNHERKMKELVNNRCFEIAKMFRTAISQIKEKEKHIEQLDHNVTVLLNTVKDNKQSLRITRIKQQCIQALQQQHYNLILCKQRQKGKQQENQRQSQKRSRAISNCMDSNSKYKLKFHDQIQMFEEYGNMKSHTIQSAKQTSGCPKYTQPQRQLFTLRSTPSEQSMHSQNQASHNETNKSLTEPYFLKSSTQMLLHKKSPFQANQLLMISSTLPIQNTVANHEEKIVQYSFRKPANSFNKNMGPRLCAGSYDQKGRRSIQRNKYQILKNSLINLIQGTSRQIWLDNLNCLRRKNGTYLLDLQGNALMSSFEDFQRLIAENLIVQPGSVN